MGFLPMLLLFKQEWTKVYLIACILEVRLEQWFSGFSSLCSPEVVSYELLHLLCKSAAWQPPLPPLLIFFGSFKSSRGVVGQSLDYITEIS